MAIILRPARPVTDEELLELSRLNPGYQFERDARGELIMAPTGNKSGRREGDLFAQLYQWAQRDGAGLVFGPSTGFKFPDGSVRAPDASWVRHDRWDSLSDAEQNGFAPLYPDAVFELASPDNRPHELREKMGAYLQNGARLGVLIDPESRTVEVYRSSHEPETHNNPASVSLDPDLPRYALDLGPIFQ